MSTPHLKYRVPSETQPHLRALLAWPDITSQPQSVGFIQPGDLELARQEVAAIANAISNFEPVWLLTKPSNVEHAEAVGGNVSVKPVEIDQLWIRDTGPIFVFTQDDALAGVDTNFNYWGANFDIPNGADPGLAQRFLEKESIPRIKAPFVSEGGALEFDGEGTLLVTASALLNSNRNPGKSKAQLEEELKTTFGVSKIIWLEGIAGVDDTDYHVDAFARFAPNDTILLSRPNSEDSETFDCYLEARSVLQGATNAAGRALKVVEIREARTVPRAEKANDASVCLSYVNYYLANGAVIVPVFGDEYADSKALQTIQEVWSDREVVPVRLNWMAWAGGGVHCATQQWPMAKA